MKSEENLDIRMSVRGILFAMLYALDWICFLFPVSFRNFFTANIEKRSLIEVYLRYRRYVVIIRKDGIVLC